MLATGAAGVGPLLQTTPTVPGRVPGSTVSYEFVAHRLMAAARKSNRYGHRDATRERDQFSGILANWASQACSARVSWPALARA